MREVESTELSLKNRPENQSFYEISFVDEAPEKDERSRVMMFLMEDGATPPKLAHDSSHC